MFQAKNKTPHILSPLKNLSQSIITQPIHSKPIPQWDKENYHLQNIHQPSQTGKKLSFDSHLEQGITQNKQTEQIQQMQTETTQQSIVFPANLSLSHVEFSDHSTQSHKDISNHPISQQSFCINQQLAPSRMEQSRPQQPYCLKNCFNCEMSRLDIQKEYSIKQMQMSDKHVKEKEVMRQEMSVKYNKLWQKYNEQNKLIIHLQHQNKGLSYEVQKLNYQLESQNKVFKRLLKEQQGLLKKQKQELVLTVQNNLRSKLQQKDKLIKLTGQQKNELNKVINQLQSDKQELDSRLRQKIIENESQTFQLISNLKRHYETKIALVEQRHQSQIYTMLTQHNLKQQILIQENHNYRQLVTRKDLIIEKFNHFVQESHQFELHSDSQLSLGEISDSLDQKINFILEGKELIEQQLTLQMQSSLQFIYKKHEMTVSRLQDQLQILKYQNNSLREQLQKLKFQSLQMQMNCLIEKKKSLEQNMDLQTQNQQKDKSLDGTFVHGQELKNIIEKQKQAHSRELSAKQAQMSLLQQAITSLQQQCLQLNQQLQDKQVYYSQLLQTKSKQHQQSILQHQQMNHEQERKINQLTLNEKSLKMVIQQQNTLIQSIR